MIQILMKTNNNNLSWEEGLFSCCVTFLSVNLLGACIRLASNSVIWPIYLTSHPFKHPANQEPHESASHLSQSSINTASICLILGHCCLLLAGGSTFQILFIGHSPLRLTNIVIKCIIMSLIKAIRNFNIKIRMQIFFFPSSLVLAFITVCSR